MCSCSLHNIEFELHFSLQKHLHCAIMIVIMRLFQLKTDFQTPRLTRTQYRAGELFWLHLETKLITWLVQKFANMLDIILPLCSFVFSCPGRMFSYCVRARAYTHVLARVYSTRASTCTLYTCFTLPHTCVNLTGLQLWVFQRARSFVNEIRTSMLSNKCFTGAYVLNWSHFCCIIIFWVSGFL